MISTFVVVLTFVVWTVCFVCKCVICEWRCVCRGSTTSVVCQCVFFACARRAFATHGSGRCVYQLNHRKVVVITFTIFFLTVQMVLSLWTMNKRLEKASRFLSSNVFLGFPSPHLSNNVTTQWGDKTGHIQPRNCGHNIQQKTQRTRFTLPSVNNS